MSKSKQTASGLRQIVIGLVVVFAVLRIVTFFVRRNVEADQQHWAKAVEGIGHSPEALCRTECALIETREQPDADVFDMDLKPCSNLCVTSAKEHWGGNFEESYRGCRRLCRDRFGSDGISDSSTVDEGGAFKVCLSECVETHLRFQAAFEPDAEEPASANVERVPHVAFCHMQLGMCAEWTGLTANEFAEVREACKDDAKFDTTPCPKINQLGTCEHFDPYGMALAPEKLKMHLYRTGQFQSIDFAKAFCDRGTFVETKVPSSRDAGGT